LSIRFLLSSHGASLFGAERVLLALAGGLAARRHDVTLELPHAGPAHDVAQRLERVRLISTHRRRLPRNATELVRYAAGFPAGVRALRAVIQRGRYDVVWANSLFNPLPALAARGTGAAVAWHVHERNFAGVAGRAAVYWIRSRADLAIAPSRFVAQSFTDAGLAESRVRVVPNALLAPVTPVPHRPSTGRFVAGYIGQFEPRKRAPDVLEAVAQLAGAGALLIGDGKARGAVEAARKRLQLGDRARLTGFQRDVRPFLADCDCIVIPSRDEPFGLVALEAMAAGLPVVAARSGALPEVLGDGALYYPLGDVTALAAALRRLRDEPRLAAELRTRGLDRVREYSLERMLDHVEAIARELLERRRRAPPTPVRA
jgi:glycosyltransferase involved in cell wall biosynthesis